MFDMAKWIGVSLTVVAAFSTIGAGAASADTAKQSATPSSQPPFSFCNNTNPDPKHPDIACFTSDITFLDKDEFQLTHVKLTDTLNDNRSVFALVEWNGGKDELGTCVYPFTFANTRGYRKSTKPEGGIHASKDGIELVKIELFACSGGLSQVSKPVTSKPRYNPFYPGGPS